MGFEQDLHEFEEKWQEKWDEKGIFQPEPDNREKFYITVAYPYPSGGMHVGHVRTFTLPDVFARYKRMNNYNVLFPMAWHVTGTPIIGAVNRLKNGEEEQIKVLTETYRIPEEDLENLETPMEYANYFIENSYKNNMKRLGFSVDWRREFTTNDKRYNKFVEWQYKSLKEKDLVKKGQHPTKYCTSDKNPVTTHDLLEGENAEQQEYTLVKFRKGNKVFPMATLRPETVYGVTHALINPEGDYVQVKINGELWILSKEATEKLEHQNNDIIIKHEMKGRKFVGKSIKNPVTEEKILVLPASFVDTDSGSGIVMSVPGHAPYDWISLEELKKDEEKLKKFGLPVKDVKKIEPKSIIDVEGYGEFPAKEEVEKLGITSQNDVKKLEKATETVYKKEFHGGELKDNCGDFSGCSVQKIKDKLIQNFEEDNKFDSMWDFSEKVKCRCGGKVIVAETDTWFLDYGDKSWKDKANILLGNMETIPENTRSDYNHTINWLKSWPCIRNYGLGTKLPFDDEFVVEPLSDSTIYMSLYTIKHLINDLEPENLNKEFFDFVFRGVGPVKDVSDRTGVSVEKLKECRESFEYWYPLDWRTSANDLIQNHLTFMMFHHAALFDRNNWPKGVATWGMGLLEGKKMSSSKGHVILPEDAIEKHGADTVRFFMFSSSEPWQDFDWREKEVLKAKEKLANFYSRSLDLHGKGSKKEMMDIDRYVFSKLQKIIRDATKAMENFQTRKASLKAFFELNNLIKKYRNRADSLNREVVKELVETQVRLMAPFIPHTCEELWKRFGKKGFVSEAEWPSHKKEFIDDDVEYREELLEKTVKDIKDIERMVGEFSEIKIITSVKWKRKALRKIKTIFEERDELEIGYVMDKITSDPELRQNAEMISKIVNDYKKNPGNLPKKVLSSKDESKVFIESKEFIGNMFDAEVEVVPEDASSHSKAKKAMPGRPAIVLD